MMISADVRTVFDDAAPSRQFTVPQGESEQVIHVANLHFKIERTTKDVLKLMRRNSDKNLRIKMKVMVTGNHGNVYVNRQQILGTASRYIEFRPWHGYGGFEMNGKWKSWETLTIGIEIINWENFVCNNQYKIAPESSLFGYQAITKKSESVSLESQEFLKKLGVLKKESMSLYGNHSNLDRDPEDIRTLEEYYKEEVGPADVILVAENEKVAVNKQYLSDISPFFEVLFSGKFREGGQPEIELKDVKFEVLVDALRIVYPTKARVNYSNYGEMVEFADRFDIDYLTKQCRRFLNSVSLVGRFVLADRYNYDELRRHLVCQLQSYEGATLLRHELRRQLVCAIAQSDIYLRMRDMLNVIHCYQREFERKRRSYFDVPRMACNFLAPDVQYFEFNDDQ